MKRFFICSVLIGFALFLVSSCTEDEKVNPVLALEQSDVTVPAEGGTYSVSYTLSNPIEGAEITASAENKEWITNLKVDETSSTISFEATPNQAEEERSTKVTLSYPNITEEVSFTIIQAGTTPAPFTITFKDAQSSSVTLDVIPRDKEITYIVMQNTQAYLDKFGLNTDDAVYKDDMKYIESSGHPLSDFCVSGDLLDKEYSAQPNTEYVFYAYGINPETSERLTDIVYAKVTTPAVDIVDAKFDIKAEVYSTIADVTVTPQNYDGPYYIEAYETASINPNLSMMEVCANSFNNVVMSYEMVGYSHEEILAQCNKGKTTRRIELQANTTYTVVAYAVNEDLQVCSEPSTLEVTTGGMSLSDNKLTINVTDITERSAQVSIKATNEDPYVYVLLEPEDLEKIENSGQDVIDYITTAYYLGYYSIGDESYSLTKLLPGSKYAVCAFGYLSGTVTTQLFRADFTTENLTFSDVTIDIPHDKYYDIAAISAIDPSLITGWDSFYDVYLPLKPTVTPEGADVDFYYAVYDYEPYFDTASEAELQNEVYYYACYEEPRDPAGSLYTVNYDDNIIIIGFAIDAEGHWSHLYKSQPFTITSSGVSDPQEFVDNYAPASTRSGNQTPKLEKPLKRAQSTETPIKGITRRSQPLVKGSKAMFYNGGELVVVRPKGKCKEYKSFQPRDLMFRAYFK